MNPFPRNLREVFERFDRVVIPEMNTGQLSRLIKAEFLLDVISINQVKGTPFKALDLERELRDLV